MFLQKNILWIAAGDSVTESERDFCAKIWKPSFLGQGYVHLLDSAIRAFLPGHGVRVINKGVGGDTSNLLKDRWQSDVLSLNPDLISIMIGVNDVWRHFDGYGIDKDLITIEKFQENYRYMIKSALDYNCKVVVLSPVMFESNKNDEMCNLVRQFSDAAKKIAEEFSVPFLNIQETIDNALKSCYSSVFSADRVHPNSAGHMLIAGEIWKFFTS